MLQGTLSAGAMRELPLRCAPNHRVNTLQHDLVGVRHVETANAWAIVVYEKTAPVERELDTIDDAHALFEQSDGEVVLLEVQYNEYGFKLRCAANGNGLVPVYFHQNGDCIGFDWDIDRLAQTIQHRAIDFQFVCRALTNPVYTHRTAFRNLQMLPVRTELTWDGDCLQLVSLEAEEPEVDIEGDAATFLLNEVSAHLRKRFHPNLKFGAELSGGMDSSFVAMMAFKAWPGAGLTLGIDIGYGIERDAQLARRSRIVREIGCSDYVVNIREHMPSYRLDQNDIESRYLLAEEYEDAFDQVWKIASREGCNVITGGYGGDELFPALVGDPSRRDRLRRTPGAILVQVESAFKRVLTGSAWQAVKDGFLGEVSPGLVGKSAKLVAVKRSSELLARGFWPIFPLLDERLAAGMLAATADERHEKRALQLAISTLLHGDDMFSAYEKETFEEASSQSLQMHLDKVLQSLNESRLIDLGILRPNVLDGAALGDLSQRSNPYWPVLTALFAAEKFARRNFQH
ncbi:MULTISPECIES: asparagine synthase-related protein [unclassified Bradyrhizobium]|uniref:asparagine synthase-related protein n=1 Tax=unclassified Bradyrhizobium TaxID=2631580 RepID=UPI0028E6F38E|nr:MULTISPECIES: asparagine synthase-related protein [unclassified Bradyrhizobium]